VTLQDQRRRWVCLLHFCGVDVVHEVVAGSDRVAGMSDIWIPVQVSRAAGVPFECRTSVGDEPPPVLKRALLLTATFGDTPVASDASGVRGFAWSHCSPLGTSARGSIPVEIRYRRSLPVKVPIVKAPLAIPSVVMFGLQSVKPFCYRKPHNRCAYARTSITVMIKTAQEEPGFVAHISCYTSRRWCKDRRGRAPAVAGTWIEHGHTGVEVHTPQFLHNPGGRLTSVADSTTRNPAEAGEIRTLMWTPSPSGTIQGVAREWN